MPLLGEPPPSLTGGWEVTHMLPLSHLAPLPSSLSAELRPQSIIFYLEGGTDNKP